MLAVEIECGGGGGVVSGDSGGETYVTEGTYKRERDKRAKRRNARF
jgi:hypothetical protein